MRQAMRVDGEALGLRDLHPGRRPRLLAHLLRRERPPLGRGAAGRPARRRGRLPDLRQHLGLRAGVLPRLLRARLHHHPAARPGGRAARHRPDLVRRDARREHADLVHAPAVRLRAVLPALGGAEGALRRQGHRQADGAGDHRPDLLGRGAVRRASRCIMVGAGHHLPAAWSCTTRGRHRVDPSTIQQLDIPQMEELPPLDFGPRGRAADRRRPPGLEAAARSSRRARCRASEPPPAPPQAGGPRSGSAAGEAARSWPGASAWRHGSRPSGGLPRGGSRSCRSCTRPPATTDTGRRGTPTCCRRSS